MSLNNLKKTTLHYKHYEPESIVTFVDGDCDLFLITSSMVIFNPMIHTISNLKLFNGDEGERLRHRIHPKRSLYLSDSIFENIYFIRFRESNIKEEKLMLNEIKIKKVIISGWYNKTNWLLPF